LPVFDGDAMRARQGRLLFLKKEAKNFYFPAPSTVPDRCRIVKRAWE